MFQFFRCLTICVLFWAVQTFSEERAYQVEGMHCGGCTQTIESAFMKNSAVKDCRADFKTGTLKIEYKDGQSLDQKTVAKILEDAGYSLVQEKK